MTGRILHEEDVFAPLLVREGAANFSQCGSPAEFQEALKDAEGINKSLRLFDIVTGDNDALVGKANTEFDAELTRLNIRHGHTVVPGTHSMFVWQDQRA
jgi:enterochelin esterase-like enzyme